MFAGEALGMAEDPATGSAQGPLAAYCLKYGILPARAEVRMRVEQGFEIGRRSILDTRLTMQGPRVTAVHVGGAVVDVGGGWIDLCTASSSARAPASSAPPPPSATPAP